jgi:glycerol-3-phosphate cytidylyltransferase
MKKKGHRPVFRYSERCEILLSLRAVHDVFPEESLELKSHYLKEQRADRLVMGADWQGHFDYCSDVCLVEYLPRTDGISTSELKRVIANDGVTEL